MTHRSKLTLPVAHEVKIALKYLIRAKVYGSAWEVRCEQRKYDNAVRRDLERKKQEEEEKKWRDELARKERERTERLTAERNVRLAKQWHDRRFHQAIAFFAEEDYMPAQSSNKGFRRLLSEH